MRVALILTLLFISSLALALRPAAPPADPPPPHRPGWAELEVPPRRPTAESMEEKAEQIYGWNCLPCHGPDGRGDGPAILRLGRRARDFTLGRFKLKTSGPGEPPHDDDLYRTILGGITAGGMPASAQFAPEELWALVDHVKGLSKRALDDGRLRDPFAVPPASRIAGPPEGAPDLRRGEALYRETQCGVCHGASGSGDGPAAAGLSDEDGLRMPIPDLSRGEAAFKGGARIQDVYRVLTSGMSGTPMPAFPSLSDRERRDLAAFIVSRYRPLPPGERIFQVAGCLSCHTQGQGRLIGPDLAGSVERRGRDWLRRWLRNPAEMIATDEQARALAQEYPVRMPAPGLDEREIELLIDYLGMTRQR